MTTNILSSFTFPNAIFANPAASVLLPIALGTGVGLSTRPKKTQNTYLSLKLPPLRPPPWIFGPVWTALYGMMGYAAHRAYVAGASPLALPATTNAARLGSTLFTIQLAINLAWQPLFFVAKRPVLATLDILALLGLNGYLTYLWSDVDPVSSWLMAPYLGWLSFATYLCIGTAHLNNWDLKTPTQKSNDNKRQ